MGRFWVNVCGWNHAFNLCFVWTPSCASCWWSTCFALLLKTFGSGSECVWWLSVMLKQLRNYLTLLGPVRPKSVCAKMISHLYLRIGYDFRNLRQGVFALFRGVHSFVSIDNTTNWGIESSACKNWGIRSTAWKLSKLILPFRKLTLTCNIRVRQFLLKLLHVGFKACCNIAVYPISALWVRNSP